MQILFEFATDGPGFMGDEPYETLGEKLSLPPFLEPKREEIEKLVRPIDTVRSTKEFIKVTIEIISRRAGSFSGSLELLAFCFRFISILLKCM